MDGIRNRTNGESGAKYNTNKVGGVKYLLVVVATAAASSTTVTIVVAVTVAATSRSPGGFDNHAAKIDQK